MKKPNLKGAVASVQQFATKHSPEILMGFGIAGMITSTVMAVSATPKALKLIEEKKEAEEVEELTVVDTVKTTWKCYIPAATMGVVSIGCLIGANSVNARRKTALATAYKISEKALSEYREKVIETIGEKKEKEVQDAIAKDQIEKNPISNNTVILTGKGNTLCYDSFSGRYFRSDIEKIRKAENILNKQMFSDMYMSLNEFYGLIDLEPTDVGSQIGWSMDDGLLEIEFSAQLSEDDEPCLVMSFSQHPRYNYYKFG